MDLLIIATTSKLLLFLWLIRGTYGVLVHHNVSATAVEGQNVSLQCIVGEEHAITIIQLEWSKLPIANEKIEQKIVVFHPQLEAKYFKNDSLLKVVTSPNTGKLLGSILTLYKVTVEDSGNYVCEITSFPNGSIKKRSKLQVSEPPASVKMLDSYSFYKEGDKVKITCSASPPPLQYKLKRSKDELFSKTSLNGEFILLNVNRKNSDLYICLPEWDSQERNRQGLNATMELTVNYLDGIECNMSSSLNISVGEDVVISCMANASQILLYEWMMGGERLSLSHTLALTSVKSEQSGTYKLTAAFQNKQLQKNNEVYIHVLSKQSKVIAVKEITTCLPLKTTEHLRSSTTLKMKSWSSSGATESETSTKSDPILTSTSKSNITVTNIQPRNTIHHAAHTDSSPAPPAGTASTLHTSAVLSIDTTHTNNTSTSPDRENRRITVPSVTTQKGSTTTVTAAKGLKSKAFVAVPIVLMLLVLLVLLYRRYRNQKKMDRPPPFKPPPPPVKYTSVRNHDIRMTDILV
ncbi:T-cell surface protein tactile [Danio aesculapii]|uniref:T-cell surface protein tactile n=1 Tax=Danio aesculapii TaxID=1142201 RepID=UPI0024BF6448|nr:T-cell surface protein tactile [Danio aesculapii]